MSKENGSVLLGSRKQTGSKTSNGSDQSACVSEVEPVDYDTANRIAIEN